MKPTRNRVMCPDCWRAKMLFESEEKAQRFIDWNGEDLPWGGESLRPYYCPACCGWHISHKRYSYNFEGKTDKLIKAFHTDLSNKQRSKDERTELDYEQEAKRIFNDFPNEIKLLVEKSKIRKYITDYFREHSIIDTGGKLRGKLYDEWIKFRNEIKN